MLSEKLRNNILVGKDRCTGCGACAYVCPKQCIEMRTDDIFGYLPHVNTAGCIECNKCQKICPILYPVEVRKTIEVYASRSLDREEARTSASGGIACSIYRHALSKGYSIAGAVQHSDFSVNLIVGNYISDIERFKNSKYVFCNASSLYPQLAGLLKLGRRVVVAGLPCHIAAIRKIFHDHPNIFLIDIVCHGTTPTQFLQQHISYIEKKLNQKAENMCFRDPKFFTNTFTFSLYNCSGDCIYAKRTKDGDTYQYGYHRAVSYRENCYQCPFAQPQRTGDISLDKYPGLEKKKRFPKEKKYLNCVLINTEKGKLWFKEMIDQHLVQAYSRPVEEPVLGNAQLRHSVAKSKDRMRFIDNMCHNGGDFEKAMMPIMKRGLRKEKMNRLSLFPRRVVGKVIRMLKQLRK